MSVNDNHINQLIQNFQEGDIEAFEQLYVLLKPSLYAFLFRFTKDEQLCIDLVQDAFVKLHENGQRYDVKKATLKTYLFQIGYNLMLNKLNRRKKWERIIPFLVPSHSEMMKQDEKLTIREAILQLSESHRAIIILSYYHEMTYNEISQVVGIPVGTVKSRLHHAIIKLREFLEVDLHGQEKAR